MTYKQKLTDLLKTIPEIKEDIMEFRTWFKLDVYEYWPSGLQEYWYDDWQLWWEEYILWKDDIFYSNEDWYEIHLSFIEDLISWKETLEKSESIKDIEIIWNPLEERHLRMYCESKWKNILIHTNEFWTGLYISQNDDYWRPVVNMDSFICNLDNEEPFSEQTEKVYEDIYNFLTNIWNDTTHNWMPTLMSNGNTKK